MTPQQTFFAWGWKDRDLARYFAERSSSKRARDGGPALVLASVPESVVDRLRRLGLFRMTGFDPADTTGMLLAGADAWLDASSEPDLQRIVLLDGPSVLGWDRWREICLRHTVGLIAALIQDGIADQWLVIFDDGCHLTQMDFLRAFDRHACQIFRRDQWRKMPNPKSLLWCINKAAGAGRRGFQEAQRGDP